MPELLAAAGADYLEQLLNAAIHVPAAAGDPASGTVVGRILALLAAKQEDERLEPYFSWDAGQPTSYELRYYDDARRIVSRAEYARVGEALRAAGESVSKEGQIAEVVARVGSGEERSVLAVRDGTPVYRMPEIVGGGVAVFPEDRGPVRRSEGAPEAADEPLQSSPRAAEIFATLRQMLAGMTVHVDATAIEEVVREAMDELRRGAAAKKGVGPDVGLSRLTDPGTLDQMARAIALQFVDLIPSAADIADKVTRNMAGESRRSGPAEAHPPPTVFEPLDPAAQDALAAEQVAGRPAIPQPAPLRRTPR